VLQLRGIWVGLLLVVAVSGCAHQQCCQPPRRGPDVLAIESLPAAVPRDVALAGPSLALVEQRLGVEKDYQGQLRALTPRQCQCLAVRYSSLGNLLAAERRTLHAAQLASDEGPTSASCLIERVLRAAELEARNQSAATALELYYRLAEAESNRPLAAASLVEADSALAKVGELRKEHMEIPLDATELDRQRLDALDRQTELRSKIVQLNAKLIPLVGLASHDLRARVLPQVDWNVSVVPINVLGEVLAGLSLRPQLAALSLLARTRPEELLAARSSLVAISPLAGKSPGAALCLLAMHRKARSGADECESAARREQIRTYAAQRRREIAGEIAQAAQLVETRVRQVALANEKTATWETRIAQLEAKRTVGSGTFLDISNARLKHLQAQSDQRSRVMDWNIAKVKLAESQGRLVLECSRAGCGAQPGESSEPETLAEPEILSEPAVLPEPAESSSQEPTPADTDEPPTDDSAPAVNKNVEQAPRILSQSGGPETKPIHGRAVFKRVAAVEPLPAISETMPSKTPPPKTLPATRPARKTQYRR